MFKIEKTMRRKFFILLLNFLMISTTSCGGGTTGSSATSSLTERVFQGTIKDPTGKPIEGATVTVLESGDSSKTDVDGNFKIETFVDGDTQEVEITVREGDNIRITSTTTSPDGVFVIEYIYAPKMMIKYKDYVFTFSVIGEKCSDAFYDVRYSQEEFHVDSEDNVAFVGATGGQFIQYADIPYGSECIIRSEVTKKNKPLGSLNYKLLSRSCNVLSYIEGQSGVLTQNTTQEVVSGVSNENGITDVSFPFNISEQNCAWEFYLLKGGELSETVIINLYTKLANANG
jgi:hypothetical protein